MKIKNLNLSRIRELREERGLTQQEVAEELGITQQVYSNYERGARMIPVLHFVALCQFYNVTCDYMLHLSDISMPEKY